MHRTVLAALALCACTDEGDLYGGGAGLTLTFEMPDDTTVEMHWEGAAKSDLREVNGGLIDGETTWDPVALGAENEGEWAVRADDAFEAQTRLEELGIDGCVGIGETFTAFANEGSFGFFAELSVAGERRYVQVAGAIPASATVGLFDGEVRAPTQWAGDFVECGASGADLPDAFTASWSLDEDVSVPNKCIGCGLALPEFDIQFDVNLTF